jgi:hypothetical protein
MPTIGPSLGSGIAAEFGEDDQILKITSVISKLAINIIT